MNDIMNLGAVLKYFNALIFLLFKDYHIILEVYIAVWVHSTNTIEGLDFLLILIVLFILGHLLLWIHVYEVVHILILRICTRALGVWSFPVYNTCLRVLLLLAVSNIAIFWNKTCVMWCCSRFIVMMVKRLRRLLCI
jgi:hypothetical protein